MANFSLVFSFFLILVLGNFVFAHHHHHHDDYEYDHFDRKDCFSAAEYKTCRKKYPVWTWDYRYEDCVLDITGGCGETANAFTSKHECRRIAEPVCADLNIYLEKQGHHHHGHHHHH
ncbi:unnamed protein product [Phyllotreta striolata]|uniref:BPTI/Kunitz inhibitor domain-containing protein n=1 Tax=Phyllotreta striolata TaxID=444603 RepID=A0A9N9TE17_PHYSR|nr:unnamed protein product [Phyllotreta striolata]